MINKRPYDNDALSDDDTDARPAKRHYSEAMARGLEALSLTSSPYLQKGPQQLKRRSNSSSRLWGEEPPRKVAHFQDQNGRHSYSSTSDALNRVGDKHGGSDYSSCSRVSFELPLEFGAITIPRLFCEGVVETVAEEEESRAVPLPDIRALLGTPLMQLPPMLPKDDNPLAIVLYEDPREVIAKSITKSKRTVKDKEDDMDMATECNLEDMCPGGGAVPGGCASQPNSHQLAGTTPMDHM